LTRTWRFIDVIQDVSVHAKRCRPSVSQCVPVLVHDLAHFAHGRNFHHVIATKFHAVIARQVVQVLHAVRQRTRDFGVVGEALNTCAHRIWLRFVQTAVDGVVCATNKHEKIKPTARPFWVRFRVVLKDHLEVLVTVRTRDRVPKEYHEPFQQGFVRIAWAFWVQERH